MESKNPSNKIFRSKASHGKALISSRRNEISKLITQMNIQIPKSQKVQNLKNQKSLNKSKCQDSLFYDKCCPEQDSCSIYEQESFDLLFQVVQTGQLIAVGDPVSVQVKASRIGNTVTLQIPGFNIDIKDMPSFIFSVQKPIPRKFRPTTEMSISFYVGSDRISEYEGHVNYNGVIWFTLPGGGFIDPGAFVSLSSSVSYITTPFVCVDNFKIATWGASNALLTTFFGFPDPGQYLEYNGFDFQQGRIMTVWADNVNTPSGAIFTNPLNVAFSRLDVKTNQGKDCHKNKDNKNYKIKQVIGPEYLFPAPFDENEFSLAINPRNADMVAFTGGIVNFPPGLENFGNLYGVSYDGGKSFTIDILFVQGQFTPSAFGADSVLVWDRFDNLYNAYLSADLTQPNFPGIIVIVGSPKGDPTKFRVIQVLGPTPGFAGTDYPRISIGPSNNPTGAIDGGRSDAIWVTFQQQINNFVAGPFVAFTFQSNGPLPDDPSAPLTNISNRRRYELDSYGDIAGAPEVAVGANGDVLITVASAAPGLDTGINTFFLCKLLSLYNPDGVNGNFSLLHDIAEINMEIQASIGPQNIRTASPWPRPVADLSNSPFRGRFYLSYTDVKLNHSGDGINTPGNGQIIMLTWTDNGGVSWAEPIQVNNDFNNPNSSFQNVIALDRSTGDVAVGWYDARQDKGNHKDTDRDGVPNTDVVWSGAVITVEQLKEIEKQRKKKIEIEK